MFNNFVNKFKKFLSVFVSLCILTCFVNTNNIVFSSDNTIVHYDSEKELVPDDNLREAIKCELIYEGVIKNETAVFTKEDLSDLGKLKKIICHVSDFDMSSLADDFVSVENLEGLQYCDSLTNLAFMKYDFTNSDFSKLPENIRELMFYDCDFTNSDFSKLPQKIEELTIRSCDLTELPDVLNLKNLKRLNLECNNITDISGLADLNDVDVNIDAQYVIQKTVLLNEDGSVEFRVPKMIGRNGKPLELQQIIYYSTNGNALGYADVYKYDEIDSRVFCRVPDYEDLLDGYTLMQMFGRDEEFRKRFNSDMEEVYEQGLPELQNRTDNLMIEICCVFMDPTENSDLFLVVYQPSANAASNLDFMDAYFNAKYGLKDDYLYENKKKFFSYQDRTYTPLGDRDFFKPGKVSWFCEESNGKESWYGVDIPYLETDSKCLSALNPFFYFEWVPYEKLKEKPEYNSLDESVKSSIDHDKCSMFYAGLIECGGNKLDLDALFIDEEDEDKKYVELYVEIGKDWDLEDLKSVYIADGPDEHIEVRSETMICPDGQERTFGVLKLKHFSPYFIFDSKNSSVLLNSTVIICVSSVILVLALGSLFLIFKNKKRN